MTRRTILSRQTPTPPQRPFVFSQNVADHATGRSQAMAQMLIQVAYLKSSGKLGSQAPTVSYQGARYQDFKGSRDYVRAHRAVFSLNVHGRNIADFATKGTPLSQMLIASQASTDPLPPPANYGDRLVEIVAAEPVIALFRTVTSRQKAGQPVEIHLLQDTIHRFQEVFAHAHDQAIDKSRQMRRNKGYIDNPTPEEMRRFFAHCNTSNDSGRPQSDADFSRQVESDIAELFTNGPQSHIVSHRMENLKFAIVNTGPSLYGDVADLYIGSTKDHAQHHPPAELNAHVIGETCERLAQADGTTT